MLIENVFHKSTFEKNYGVCATSAKVLMTKTKRFRTAFNIELKVSLLKFSIHF